MSFESESLSIHLAPADPATGLYYNLQTHCHEYHRVSSLEELVEGEKPSLAASEGEAALTPQPNSTRVDMPTSSDAGVAEGQTSPSGESEGAEGPSLDAVDGDDECAPQPSAAIEVGAQAAEHEGQENPSLPNRDTRDLCSEVPPRSTMERAVWERLRSFLSLADESALDAKLEKEGAASTFGAPLHRCPMRAPSPPPRQPSTEDADTTVSNTPSNVSGSGNGSSSFATSMGSPLTRCPERRPERLYTSSLLARSTRDRHPQSNPLSLTRSEAASLRDLRSSIIYDAATRTTSVQERGLRCEIFHLENAMRHVREGTGEWMGYSLMREGRKSDLSWLRLCEAGIERLPGVVKERIFKFASGAKCSGRVSGVSEIQAPKEGVDRSKLGGERSSSRERANGLAVDRRITNEDVREVRTRNEGEMDSDEEMDVNRELWSF